MPKNWGIVRTVEHDGGMQVHVEDAELLTDWQRRQAEFKQRRAISGAEGAKAKQERMKQFQQRLRGAAAAGQPAPAPKIEPTAEVKRSPDTPQFVFW